MMMIFSDCYSMSDTSVNTGVITITVSLSLWHRSFQFIIRETEIERDKSSNLRW